MQLLLLDASTTMSTPMVLAIVAFIIAGLLLASAVVLFIRFKIPALISDLSGKAAQKRIKEMRAQGTFSSARSSYKPSPVSVNKTPVQSVNKPMSQKSSPPSSHSAEHTGYTDDIKANTDGMTVKLDGVSTSDQDTGDITTASLDFSVDGGTEVLEQGTVVLSPEQIQQSIEASKTVEGFKVIQSIVLVHTDETILI